jgi:hypothetical protein
MMVRRPKALDGRLLLSAFFSFFLPVEEKRLKKAVDGFLSRTE